MKGSKSIGYWIDYATLPFELTHDLDIEFSSLKFEIVLSQLNDRNVNQSFMASMVTLCGGWDYWIVTGVTSSISLPSGDTSSYKICICSDLKKINLRLILFTCNDCKAVVKYEIQFKWIFRPHVVTEQNSLPWDHEFIMSSEQSPWTPTKLGCSPTK